MPREDLAVSICSLCFNLAPKQFSDLEAGSVKAFRLTQRAPDEWYAPLFGLGSSEKSVPFR